MQTQNVEMNTLRDRLQICGCIKHSGVSLPSCRTRNEQGDALLGQLAGNVTAHIGHMLKHPQQATTLTIWMSHKLLHTYAACISALVQGQRLTRASETLKHLLFLLALLQTCYV